MRKANNSLKIEIIILINSLIYLKKFKISYNLITFKTLNIKNIFYIYDKITTDN